MHLARAVSGNDADRVVAVKLLPEELVRDAGFLDIFLEEAAFATTLRHPNMVSTLDVGASETAPFTIMEYVQGDSLANIITTATRLARFIPYGVTLRIIIDALKGLAAAHEARTPGGAPRALLHRDLSPRAMLVGVDGVTRVGDLGIARALAGATLPQPRKASARLSYVAPEQLAGKAIDQRADIYSIGVILWNALTLQALFTISQDATRTRFVAQGEYRPVNRFHVGVPEALDGVIRRAVSTDRAQRFDSAADFARAIESIRGVSIASTREVSAFVAGAAAHKIQQERDAVNAMRAAIGRPARSSGSTRAVTPTHTDPPNTPLRAATPVPRNRTLDDGPPPAFAREVRAESPSEVELELDLATAHVQQSVASAKIAEAVTSSAPRGVIDPLRGPSRDSGARAVGAAQASPTPTPPEPEPPPPEAPVMPPFQQPPSGPPRALVIAGVVALVALGPLIWLATHR